MGGEGTKAFDEALSGLERLAAKQDVTTAAMLDALNRIAAAAEKIAAMAEQNQASLRILAARGMNTYEQNRCR